MAPAQRGLTVQDLQAAIEEAFEERAQPTASDAYEVIRPSVVRVRGLPEPGAGELEGFVADESVGTGVVIVEDGTILTNLHVVHGAQRLSVTFFDGTESEATIVGARPEHDLAVIRARTLPDDLAPATMRSTADLAPGDTVVAVGFPFGIGPSASAGVVSGLKRPPQKPQKPSPSGRSLLSAQPACSSWRSDGGRRRHSAGSPRRTCRPRSSRPSRSARSRARATPTR